MYSRFNSRKAVSAIVGYRVNIIPEKLFLFGHVWTFLINVIQAEGPIKLKNRWHQYRPASLAYCPTASDRLEEAAREVCICTQSFCFSAKYNVHNSDTWRKKLSLKCPWLKLNVRPSNNDAEIKFQYPVPQPLSQGMVMHEAQLGTRFPVVCLRPPSLLIFWF